MNVEYKTIDMHDHTLPVRRILPNSSITSRLNQYAAEGWRVVNFDVDCTLLERPAIAQDLNFDAHVRRAVDKLGETQ